jgi:hypothetical protein
LVDVFLFDTVTYSCTAHKNVHTLVKAARAVYREIRTVVCRDVATIKSGASGHKRPHTGKHFEVVDGVAEFAEILLVVAFFVTLRGLVNIVYNV